MRIIGQHDGATVADFLLAHGDDPTRALRRRGWSVERPTGASTGVDGVELTLGVREIEPSTDTGRSDVRREPGIADDTVPVVKQRVAAYAVVRSTRGLLATEFSDRTGAPGRWGLPGGGIDDGEEPAAAALREVREESGQSVVLEGLAVVDTDHWIGVNPSGVVEDYHAVRLVYRAACPDPTDPVVLDVGGTTSAARWVPLDAWRSLDWAPSSRRLLTELLEPGTSSPIVRDRVGEAGVGEP